MTRNALFLSVSVYSPPRRAGVYATSRRYPRSLL